MRYLGHPRVFLHHDFYESQSGIRKARSRPAEAQLGALHGMTSYLHDDNSLTLHFLLFFVSSFFPKTNNKIQITKKG